MIERRQKRLKRILVEFDYCSLRGKAQAYICMANNICMAKNIWLFVFKTLNR